MAGRTVADAVADGLLAAGAARVFAARSAGAEIIAAARRRGLDVVDVTADSVAATMAAITGELSDGPGVLVLGAAAAEAAAGLVYAFATGAPMLVVSETTLEPSLVPAVKASVEVSPQSAASIAAGAAWLARTEPCGPVHLILRPEVAQQPAGIGGAARPAPTLAPDSAALDEAAERLKRAARPVLIAGSQCRSGLAARWIRALAEAMPAPVLVTAKARGVLPDPHPLALGGDGDAASLLGRADLVVVIGLDAREAAPPVPATTPFLYFAATPPLTGWTPATTVLGDVGLVIEELAPRLRGRGRADWDVAELDRLKRASSARAARAVKPAGRVVTIVRELTPAGTIATADGETCGPAMAAWLAAGPNELLTAAPGPPAFAPAAAVAARLALADRLAVAFTDAAGLAAADAALETAARLRVGILIIALGEAGPDVAPVILAERHGIAGVAAPTGEALARAVTRALATNAPCLIDARAGRAAGSPV